MSHLPVTCFIAISWNRFSSVSSSLAGVAWIWSIRVRHGEERFEGVAHLPVMPSSKDITRYQASFSALIAFATVNLLTPRIVFVGNRICRL